MGASRPRSSEADAARKSKSEPPERTLPLKGVVWRNRKQAWEAHIKMKDSTRFLGTFDDEMAAARAYDKVAVCVCMCDGTFKTYRA